MPERAEVAPKTVLAVASFGGFLAFLDATIVNVAVPDIARSFPDSDLGAISWVLNAYNLVFAAFLLPAGRLIDLLGRRRSFSFGIGVFTVASTLCAIAPSLELLVVGRVLQALGAAILVPASLAIVLAAYPGERRAHAVTLYTAVSVLAAGVGPAAGGVLIELYDWRLCFLVNVPIGAVALRLAGRRLVESRAPGRRAVPDLGGALQLAAGIAAITYAIVKTESWGWLDLRVISAALLGAVLLALFVRRCQTHREPILDLALLRQRSFGLANVLAVVGGAGFYSYVLCNVLFLTALWDYSALEAGLALTPGPIVAAVVAGPLGRRMTGRDPRWVIGAGALVWSAGLVFMITQVGTQPDFLGTWLPGMVLLGVGAGTTFSTLGAAAVAAAPGTGYATSTAVTAVARQFGATLGVALLVTIIGRPSDAASAAQAFDRGWLFGALCFAVIAAGIPLLGRVQIGEADAPDDEGEALTAGVSLTASTPPLPATALAPVARSRPHERELSEFLADVPLFADLDAGRLAELASGARDRFVAAGTALFSAGDPASEMYVVRTGRLEVVAPDGALLRVLGPGDVLGELGVLAGTPRSAAVVARRDSVLAELPHEHLARLIESEPGFSRSIVGFLARQLQSSRGAPVEEPPLPAIIALVAANPSAYVDELADQLAAELEKIEPLAVLRDDGSSGGDRVRRVEAAERDRGRVLLVGGGIGQDEWTSFCIRHADRVLAAVEEGPPPGFETHAGLQGCDLVVCGSPAAKAITPWFPLLGARRSHRVPDLAGAGVAALARRLTGRSVGLVLSGGGARGLAHLGVLDVIEEAGITVDRVGGCSIGAFIGGLYASGLSAAQVDAVVYEEWVRRNPINDYGIPRTSLIRGGKARQMFIRTFTDIDIERMPRSFYCVAVDLVDGELVTHRYGHAGFAVASSMLLPAFSPPAATGAGRLLVDGGLRNNLPVDLMAADGEGPIIAVDVGGEAGLAVRRREGVNGYVAPWDEDHDAILPGLSEQLLRIVTLGSSDGAALASRHAAVVIRPHNEGVGMLEFHMIDRMRAEGRRAAREALAAASQPA